MAIESDIDQFNQITFQQSNLWDFFIFESPTNLLSNFSIANLLQSVITDTSFVFEKMKFRVQTCSLPLPGLKTEELSTGRKVYKSREYEGDFAITIYEDITFSAYSYFDDWMKRVYNFDLQTWNTPPPPARTGVLIYWAGTNPDIPTATFTYENLRIKGIEDVTLSREASPLTLTVNLTFDKVSSVIGRSLVNQLKNVAFGVVSL